MGTTLVIAEPGCTAEGDHATMLRLLETAHACGSDVWKPQWVSDPVQMCERRHITVDHPQRAYYQQAYSWLAWPVEWHQDFRDRCHALGMQYAVTCFLPQDVSVVDPLVDLHKVASFEALDPAMAEAHQQTSKRLLVSQGMCDGRDLATLSALWYGVRTTFLHCVSAYPAPLESLQLHRLGPFTGYSDHSRDVMAGACAVMRHAPVVETHYRLEDCDPANPDYAVAFDTTEFAEYIRLMRKAERMRGSMLTSAPDSTDAEAPMRAYRVAS